MIKTGVITAVSELHTHIFCTVILGLEVQKVHLVPLAVGFLLGPEKGGVDRRSEGGSRKAYGYLEVATSCFQGSNPMVLAPRF